MTALLGERLGPRPLLVVTTARDAREVALEERLAARVGGPFEVIEPYQLRTADSVHARELERHVVDIWRRRGSVSMIAMDNEAADAAMQVRALSHSPHGAVDRVVAVNANLGHWDRNFPTEERPDVLSIAPARGIDRLPGAELPGAVHVVYDVAGDLSLRQAKIEAFKTGGGHKNLLAVTAHLNHLPLPQV